MPHLFGQHNLGHYRKPVLNQLDRCLLSLQEPFCTFINLFFSTFVITTLEEQSFNILLSKVVISYLWLVLALLSLPAFMVSFPMWCGLQRFRTLPFIYISSGGTENDMCNCNMEKSTFTIASCNLCLIPEVMLRWNNQMHNESKAHRIGCRIVDSQLHRKTWSNINGDCPHGFTGGISEVFPPNLDILCCQEAFHLRSTEALVEQLRTIYPYIIYDTGTNSMTSNCFMSNSGLLIASKYPVLAASFYIFPHAAHYAYFTATGLLLAKLNLGIGANGVRRVALVGSTHLQAYQGVSDIHRHQLDCITKWRDHFRGTYFNNTSRAPAQDTCIEEELVFDAICGDFNVDNLSPVDEHVWEHPMFTGRPYTDPCMTSPGTDQPWTVGTEFRSHHLHSRHATSPTSLRTSLMDLSLRRYLLLDGDLEAVRFGVATQDPPTDTCTGLTSVHEARGGRRRIDRILLNTTDLKLVAQKFYFITQLASLTDHIPVALTFTAQTTS